MAWAMVLIKISRPALDINFSFHPITLLVIFSWSSLKVLTFDFPLAIDKPRYFSQSDIIIAPNIYYIALFTSSLVFVLKNKDIFCLLIAWLEAAL